MTVPEIKLGQSDMLHGWAQIAAYLGINERQARHLHNAHSLPVFKVGSIVAANKTSIDNWSKKLEMSTA